MLGLHKHAVRVLLENPLDVSWHREVNSASIIIPFEFDPAIEVAGPFFYKFIFLFNAPINGQHALCPRILRQNLQQLT